MKTRLIALTLTLLATVTNAQIGAKADSVTIPKLGGVQKLSECVVTKIEPDGVRVNHAGGAAKIPFQYLPEAWKPFVNEKKAAEDATAKEIAVRDEKESSAKQQREAARAEIITLRVKVMSVTKDGLIVIQMEHAAPVASRSQSLGLGGTVGPVTYQESETILMLTGTIPPDVADGEMFTVQGTKGDSKKYRAASGSEKTIRSYQISEWKKGLF